MGKPSTKNQRRRQEYDALADKSRAKQKKVLGNQNAPDTGGVEATLSVVRAVSPRRPRKSQHAKRQPASTAPAVPARSLLKDIPAGITEQVRPFIPKPTIPPTPLALAKPHQLETVQTDCASCAIPRCKERDNICSIDNVSDCLEQQRYREALERFIS